MRGVSSGCLPTLANPATPCQPCSCRVPGHPEKASGRAGQAIESGVKAGRALTRTHPETGAVLGESRGPWDALEGGACKAHPSHNNIRVRGLDGLTERREARLTRIESADGNRRPARPKRAPRNASEPPRPAVRTRQSRKAEGRPNEGQPYRHRGHARDGRPRLSAYRGSRRLAQPEHSPRSCALGFELCLGSAKTDARAARRLF